MPCQTMEGNGPEKAASTEAYASFLIRLWCEGEEDVAACPPAWHAEVEHIQSGRLSAFDDVDKALSYVLRQTRGHGAPGREDVAAPDGS